MIEDLLKKASLKKTKQRYMILSIIKSEDKPVTAEDIYTKLHKDKDNINISTVYRTLNILSEKNVVLKILKEDGTASYQLSDNLHNHYITCYKCHNSTLIDKCPINDLSEKIKIDTGYVITGHSLQITGLCPKCNKNMG